TSMTSVGRPASRASPVSAGQASRACAGAPGWLSHAQSTHRPAPQQAIQTSVSSVHIQRRAGDGACPGRPAGGLSWGIGCPGLQEPTQIFGGAQVVTSLGLTDDYRRAYYGAARTAAPFRHNPARI